jgi:exopolysaccharide biosynthesis WecB/TagA/CpsF family protein
MNTTRVRIFYPADPVGIVPGGIDTFIRGLIKWAPPDIDFSLVGMTTDRQSRPLGRWSRCHLGGDRLFDFYPAVAVADAGGRSRLPLSLRYTAAIRRAGARLLDGFDVFDFHRPEPSLLFGRDARPKAAYFHQDPGDVSQKKSDMLWRHMPGLYQRMERSALAHFDRVWCVRESGVATLRQRHPGAPDQVQFIPTWVDTETFHPVPPAERQALREALATELGLDPRAQWIISVGRLDTQKDPNMMFEAFSRLVGRRKVDWLVVGDGVLRPELQRRIASAGLGERIHLLGLRAPHEVADLLRAADLYALSSAYEGMPMALLEALGSGLPVVTTAVGEVRRVVQPEVNGVIAGSHQPEAFAAALLRGLENAAAWRGEASVRAIRDYQPGVVLAPAYDSYRALGAQQRHRQQAVEHQAAMPQHLRPRRPVLGVPVDALPRTTARARLLAWAKAGESRYACFCNVHSVVTAQRDGLHRQVLAGADLVLPDGAPIAWTLRAKGRPQQHRVEGPGTMWRLCGEAEEQGIKIGLYGASASTLSALASRLQKRYPRLQIAYLWSPPYRPLTQAEDDAVCEAIRRAGVGLLFVSLGCPKQEAWMAAHRGRIPSVMLGVGAAFDFHAGVVARAPRWMRGAGLEWLHRLAGNPRRLAGRYLVTNTMFIAKSAAEAVNAAAGKLGGRGGRGGRARGVPEAAANTELMMLRTREDTVDLGAIDDLVARIDSALTPRNGRVIEFVASAPGEGTSTLASAYASANAAQLQRKVLLLVTSRRSAVGPGVLQNLALGESVDKLLTPRDDGVFVARVGSVGAGEPGWKLLRRPELWANLRSHFDLVVLDMPPLEVSRAGLKVAVACDGVVVVVQAEKTRAPVVRDLIERLRAVRGNVLGTVLNKRRFHLPARLYNWL